MNQCNIVTAFKEQRNIDVDIFGTCFAIVIGILISITFPWMWIVGVGMCIASTMGGILSIIDSFTKGTGNSYICSVCGFEGYQSEECYSCGAQVGKPFVPKERK